MACCAPRSCAISCGSSACTTRSPRSMVSVRCIRAALVAPSTLYRSLWRRGSAYVPGDGSALGCRGYEQRDEYPVVSRPRRPTPARKASRRPLPEDLARDAIAHEESLPPDKVRMTFRVVLDRRQAEALAARAIREEK